MVATQEIHAWPPKMNPIHSEEGAVADSTGGRVGGGGGDGWRWRWGDRLDIEMQEPHLKFLLPWLCIDYLCTLEVSMHISVPFRENCTSFQLCPI